MNSEFNHPSMVLLSSRGRDLNSVFYCSGIALIHVVALDDKCVVGNGSFFYEPFVSLPKSIS
jgi:hypothetical protein